MIEYFHSQHDGRLGRKDERLGVTYCAWCVVGWDDEYNDIPNPQRTLEYHLEEKHPNINRSMWEEYDVHNTRSN